MRIPTPFGQYVPGSTIIHRLDPRIKLLVLFVYVVALFLAGSWAGLLFCLFILLATYRLSHIPLKRAARGLMPILIILTFTFFANALTFQAQPWGQDTQWVSLGLPFVDLSLPQSIAIIGSFGLRPLGALNGLYFVLRIVLLVSSSSLLIFTTSVVTLSDAIAQLLRPLRAFKVPTEDIAMMFSIALRFIPLTAQEAEKIIIAQSARGVRFNEGNLFARVRVYIPVIIPLFVNLFRKADDIAFAMESRCYIGEGRTHLKQLRLGAADITIGIAAGTALITVGILL